MAGERNKVEGKVKDVVGGATGDRDMKARGKGQNAAGKVEDAAHAVKAKAKDMKDRATGR